MNHPWMWWPCGSMWIFPIFMFIAMLFCFLGFSRRWRRRTPWGSSSGHHGESEYLETALEMLKKRYAKGEITKEEFDQMKKDILS